MSQVETCFFERYARATLKAVLDSGFGRLVNRDRPDLQSPDGRFMGIEVTRAMERSKDAAEMMLDAAAGILPLPDDSDYGKIVGSGYGYGLQNGGYMGSKEAFYWSLARPLRDILQSKVSKAVCGLYGEFENMGLYVFCKDPLSEAEVIKTYKYVLELQKYADGGYDCLYLSEISRLSVCNLRDGLSDGARVAYFDISPDLRRELFIEAVE